VELIRGEEFGYAAAAARGCGVVAHSEARPDGYPTGFRVAVAVVPAINAAAVDEVKLHQGGIDYCGIRFFATTGFFVDGVVSVASALLDAGIFCVEYSGGCRGTGERGIEELRPKVQQIVKGELG